MIPYPMEIFIGQCSGIEISANIISVLNTSPLILQSDIHLTYIIYELRIDPIHLIEI